MINVLYMFSAKYGYKRDEVLGGCFENGSCT